MKGTPWVVQRTKRKQPTSTPTPRKRSRISDDVQAKKPLSGNARDQKTLTQIQWVNSPNTGFEDDSNLQEIGLGGHQQMNLRGPRHQKLSKRNSTLTQMDWLGGPQTRQNDPTDNWSMISQQSTKRQGNVPQLDGAYADSPKRKKPKLAPFGSSSSSSIDRDTQEYLPAKRRRSALLSSPREAGARRKSSRIASKAFRDPDQNSLHVDQTLPTLSVKDRRSVNRVRTPVLEVMDSYEPEDERTPTQNMLQLCTPQRRREIPSSQTPETMTVTRKSRGEGIEQSPSKHLGRSPLRERSTNLPSKVYPHSVKKRGSKSKKLTTPHKRSKICVLKVPSRALLQRSARTDEAQHDIYSLHGTSSDDPDKDNFSQRSEDIEKLNPAAIEPEGIVEIPSSSQRRSNGEQKVPSSPPGVDTGESLPELGDLIPLKRISSASFLQSSTDGKRSHQQASTENPVVVRDFGQSNFQNDALPQRNLPEQVNLDDNDIMLLDEEMDDRGDAEHPSNIDLADEDEEHYSDFGSPVANDTQFNTHLLARTSSPTNDIDTDTNVPNEANESMKEIATEKDQDKEHESETGTNVATLTPRLVQQPRLSGVQLPSSKPTTNNESVNLPPFHGSLHSGPSITSVPLNDVAEFSSSSSPMLPPLRAPTQRNTAPAPIPRPSQVSTQDPTQHYTFSSMYNPTQHHSEVVPMTVEDSSSVRLSQIPPHESQSQGLGLQLVDENDDGMDDLDLDPSSALQGRQSARKPLSLVGKEPESPLRSIHPSSDRSDELDKEDTTISSPTLQASTLRVSPSNPMQGRQTRTSSALDPQPGRNQSKEVPDELDVTSSPISSPDPPPLKRKYDPIPGFDNETQSNFTQTGHITAAYIHRQREEGVWPDWFVPEPFQLRDWKRPSKEKL